MVPIRRLDESWLLKCVSKIVDNHNPLLSQIQNYWQDSIRNGGKTKKKIQCKIKTKEKNKLLFLCNFI